MRKLLELLAVIALLCMWGVPALADSPAVSAQPNVQPDPQGSTAGGSASASGGDTGPATFTSSEPITASSSNTAGPSAPASGSTSASGPGTTANVPTTASASQPDAEAPDGSTPTPTTSGPATEADASETSVSTSDSRARAVVVANVRNAFGGSVAGIGSAEDPTIASTCSTADASPGVPTDISLGTQCGTGPSTASEDFSANGADGNGAAGTPSGSACLGASASADLSPTSDLSNTCSAQGGTTPSTGPNAGNANVNGANNGAASTDSRDGASVQRTILLGIASLPSTATSPEALSLLGAAFVLAGLGVLRRKSRQPTELSAIKMTRFANKIGRIRAMSIDRDALSGPHTTI